MACLGDGPEIEQRKRSFLECGAIVDQLQAVDGRLIVTRLGVQPADREESTLIPQHKNQWSTWIAKRSLIVVAPDIVPKLGLELSELSQLCEELKTLLCILDRPNYSNFISPAIAEKGAFQIAVSSSGISPSVSVYLRNRIENELLSDELLALAEFFSSHRRIVSERLKDLKRRRAFYFELIESGFAARLDSENALQEFQSRLDEFCAARDSGMPDNS